MRGMKPDYLINILAVILAVVGVICLAQKDTDDSKKGGVRIFGAICLGITALILIYRIYEISRDISFDKIR